MSSAWPDLQSFTPASYNEVLTATDDDGQPGGLGGTNCAGEADDTPASFSNFATLPDDQSHIVAEPGSCMPSTWLANSVARGSGTSSQPRTQTPRPPPRQRDTTAPLI